MCLWLCHRFRRVANCKISSKPTLDNLTWHICVCAWFFPDMIRTSRLCNFSVSGTALVLLLYLARMLLQWNQFGAFLFTSQILKCLTRISNRMLFFSWMCYLFIRQWVLRIISETLKFSRSMVLFECESMSKSVWAVINYGFECAYFMLVIQENEDLYLITRSHTHLLARSLTLRQKVVIVCVFFLLFFSIMLHFTFTGKENYHKFLFSVNLLVNRWEKCQPNVLPRQRSIWNRELESEARKNAFKIFRNYLKRNKKGIFNNILTVNFQTFSENNWTYQRQRLARGRHCAWMWKRMNGNKRQQFSSQPNYNSIVIITFIKNTKNVCCIARCWGPTMNRVFWSAMHRHSRGAVFWKSAALNGLALTWWRAAKARFDFCTLAFSLSPSLSVCLYSVWPHPTPLHRQAMCVNDNIKYADANARMKCLEPWFGWTIARNINLHGWI